MKSFFITARCLFTIGLLSLTTACSGADDGDGDGGGDPSSGGSSSTGSGGSAPTAGSTGSGGGSTGVTTCGSFNCEAGQHCNNAVCVNGCLTDANCGPNQSCQDIDTISAIGTCKNNPTAPTKDCDALCQKAAACGDTSGDCMQLCTAASAACVACLNDSNCGEGCEETCDL